MVKSFRKFILVTLALFSLTANARAAEIHLTGRDVSLLARTLQGEAGGESKEGQIAVAHVILNRIKHSHGREDSSVEKAVLRKGQFDVWHDKRLLASLVREREQYAQMKVVAETAVSLYRQGRDYSHGATFYCRRDKHPSWTRHMRLVAKLGGHKFYEPIEV